MSREEGGQWREGIVYSETRIHAAPTEYIADAPYQIAIVDFAGQGRKTVRIVGAEVAIGDRVEFVSTPRDMPSYRKWSETVILDNGNK